MFAQDAGNALLSPAQKMVKDNLERAAMVKERQSRLKQAEVELPWLPIGRRCAQNHPLGGQCMLQKRAALTCLDSTS